MSATTFIDSFWNLRNNLYKRRYEMDTVYKILLALSFACLTGLFAQFRFYLPFSPVPVTGQTFAVLLAGVTLGRWGGVSQAMYVGLGVIGVPWFTGMNGGLEYLMGPTGGYLIGFVLSATFLGYMSERYSLSRRPMGMLGLLMAGNFLLIYVPGLLYLHFYLGMSLNLWQLLLIGVVPFIAGDLVKITLATGASRLILPSRAG